MCCQPQISVFYRNLILPQAMSASYDESNILLLMKPRLLIYGSRGKWERSSTKLIFIGV